MSLKESSRTPKSVAPKTLQKNLEKSPTGMRGFDEITNGGLPKGRSALMVGAAGSGKTVFGMEFLVRGALQYSEPGVFMSFEENESDLAKNFSSLGYDLDDLITRKKLFIDFVYIERREIEETGEFDLDGIFVRLSSAIAAIGAKRVVLDTLESLFSGISEEAILRAELRRLFRWLKDKGVTVIITAERGVNTLTRYGLEEYVADCVILLDTQMIDQIATRRLRVIKYRGSKHGTNEYPFLIDESGISVLPITSIGLLHKASSERIPSGIERMDTMLDGGFYRGSSILVSGTPGTGKSTLAAHFANVSAAHGERCLYFAFEESPDQIIRNMRSIGINLEQWIKQGFLQFHASRPSLYGLEMHLVTMYKLIENFQPKIVIVDPISNLLTVGSMSETKSMLTRLIDFLKSKQITAMFASLTTLGENLESTEVGVSSLMDTWILLRDIESAGERNRGLYILKSRGMDHSNQIREFLFTRRGIQLRDVYIGSSGVLTGSARLAQEAKDSAQELERKQAIERNQREIEHRRQIMESQINTIRSQFEADKEKLEVASAQEEGTGKILTSDRLAIARQRKADKEPEVKLKSEQGGKNDDRY
ncbi:MAG: circadian clock protein KaiC [Methanoregulaceae archaeon]|nr:circadian clock protein KaiC [Methanoregulaceae archaeon]